MKKSFRRLFYILGGCIALLILIRVSAPYVIKRIINDRIARSENWRGQIHELSLSIFPARLELKDGEFKRSLSNEIEFSFKDLKIEVSWKGLFKKEVHLEGILQDPLFVIKMGISPPTQTEKISTAKKIEVAQEEAQTDWPIFIDRFEIQNLGLRLEDYGENAFPIFRIYDLNLVAENIWNREEKQDGPSNINFKSKTSGGGSLEGKIWLSAFSPRPIIKGQFDLKGFNLRVMNPVFQKSAHFDLKSGFLDLYIEIVTQNWKVDGYMKPLLSKVNFIDPEKQHKRSFWRQVWQGLLQFTSSILKNPETKKMATKIKFSGRLDDPTTNPWSALLTMMRNAFIEALQMGFDRDLKISPQFPRK